MTKDNVSFPPIHFNHVESGAGGEKEEHDGDDEIIKDFGLGMFIGERDNTIGEDEEKRNEVEIEVIEIVPDADTKIEKGDEKSGFNHKGPNDIFFHSIK